MTSSSFLVAVIKYLKKQLKGERTYVTPSSALLSIVAGKSRAESSELMNVCLHSVPFLDLGCPAYRMVPPTVSGSSHLN